MTNLHPAARIVDMADRFLGAQVRALSKAPAPDRRAAAAVMAHIECELDLLAETVRFAVSDGQHEDALALLERMRGMTFDGAGRYPPAVRSCFALRRDETVAELYEIVAKAVALDFGVPVTRSPAMVR
jgi:hypothetical protein